MTADQFNAFLATVQNTIANNINNNIGTPIAGTTAGSSTNPRLLSSSNDPKPPKIIKELNLNLDPNDPTHDVERVASLSKFQHCIVSQVISKTIELHLSDDALKTLMVDADKFKWTDETTQTVVYNGFMMLFMILRVVSPVVMVDASNLRAKLESLHLKQFRYNVVSLVATAQDLRQKITAKGEACDDNTFYTAVVTSN